MTIIADFAIYLGGVFATNPMLYWLLFIFVLLVYWFAYALFSTKCSDLPEEYDKPTTISEIICAVGLVWGLALFLFWGIIINVVMGAYLTGSESGAVLGGMCLITFSFLIAFLSMGAGVTFSKKILK